MWIFASVLLLIALELYWFYWRIPLRKIAGGKFRQHPNLTPLLDAAIARGGWSMPREVGKLYAEQVAMIDAELERQGIFRKHP